MSTRKIMCWQFSADIEFSWNQKKDIPCKKEKKEHLNNRYPEKSYRYNLNSYIFSSSIQVTGFVFCFFFFSGIFPLLFFLHLVYFTQFNYLTVWSCCPFSCDESSFSFINNYFSLTYPPFYPFFGFSTLPSFCFFPSFHYLQFFLFILPIFYLSSKQTKKKPLAILTI